MLLQRITIKGYRGIATTQELRLATPSGAEGSGLTVIVGPNNSGKSTVVEALGFTRNPQKAIELFEGQKNTVTNGSVQITYTTDEGPYSLTTGAAGTPAWQNVLSIPVGGRTYSFPPRRTIESSFGLNPQLRENYILQTPDFAPRRQNGSLFPGRIATIDSNREKYFSMLAMVLPDPPSWYLERNEQNNYYMKVTSGTSPHTSVVSLN